MSSTSCLPTALAARMASMAQQLESESSMAMTMLITTAMDQGKKRTSQRAELLAALAGLKHMVELDQLQENETTEPASDIEKETRKRKRKRKTPPQDLKKQ